MTDIDKSKEFTELTPPTAIIVVLQTITFIASYLIFYFLISFVAFAIVGVINNIGLFKVLSFGFPVGDTIAFTITPACVAYLMYIVNAALYKKYYFHTVSIILLFMFLSWLTISHIISTIQANGLFSWNTANWIWSDVILIAIVFYTFYHRSVLFSNKSSEAKE